MQPANDARTHRRGRCRAHRTCIEHALLAGAQRPAMQVYCHLCGSIQPLVIDEPQEGDYGAAIDLVCGTCHFIVATTYAPDSGRERRRGAAAADRFQGEAVRT